MATLPTDLHALFERALATHLRDLTNTRKRELQRNIQQLAQRNILTVNDLLTQLAQFPRRLKEKGIELLGLLKIRQAIPVLLSLLEDPAVRLQCTWAACWCVPKDRRVQRTFMQVLQRELASPTPDDHWLYAALQGLQSHSDHPDAANLILTIYERTDLPDWLRGDAADWLGGSGPLWDRRTIAFRRACAAIHRGLFEDSMEVQFGTMYLMGTLASVRDYGRTWARRDAQGYDPAFADLLPKLHQIAQDDHRLSPGFWWPMSAEAEDVITCITTGRWRRPDAGDRWEGHMERGAWNRPTW